MKTPYSALAMAVGIIIILISPTLAQQTAMSARTSQTEGTLQAMMQAIESAPPLPASETPAFGTFYSAQLGDHWPPLPGITS